MQTLTTSSAFSATIIDWQRQYGRHHLPWQSDNTLYTTWISEIMLQQTQVSTVVPYYKRFVCAFPSLRALANADLQAVLALWSGLGYYARAKNLHRCAQAVVEKHEGEFPEEFELVRQLPGIGDSTAGAILSLTLNRSLAIADGNVRRVFSRYFGLAYSDYPSLKAFDQQIWSIANALIPKNNAKWYNQGLMDLGALICRRVRADCTNCPLQSGCVSYRLQKWDGYPGKKPSTAKKHCRWHWIVCTSGDKVWLITNPNSKGIWRDMQTFLTFESDGEFQQYRKNWLLNPDKSMHFSYRPLDAIHHLCTHLSLEIIPHWLHLSSTAPGLTPAYLGAVGKWYSFECAFSAALPKPVRSVIKQLGVLSS